MNILITGATSGIGEQLARDYAAAGHKVVACGRNEQVLQQLVEAYPEAITAQPLDVTDATTTIARLRAYRQLDIVILSAGVCEYVDIDSFNSDMFERVYEVNIFGMLRCIEALLPNLTAGNQLVLVGSTARLLPFTRAEAYGSSKAALQYIARSLEVDLSQRGIVVQTVSPGFVKTPMTAVNDFAMPMAVTVEFASNAIRQGIAKKRTDITFPRLFGCLLKCLSRLPQSWQVAISKRF